MKAVDVMTLNPITVEPDASLVYAIRLMLQHRISGLPVVTAAGELVGILTEGDLLRRTETGTARHRARWLEFLVGPGRLAEEYAHASGRLVREVMSPEVETVAEDTPLDEIVQTMERRQIKRLPVVRDGKVVGIVSRANLLRALASAFYEAKAPSLDDASIKSRLLDELNKLPWASPSLTNIIVRNGEVHLWGTILDERQRQALLVAAENIPGVKTVHDHLIWVEPMTGMALASPEDQTKAATH